MISCTLKTETDSIEKRLDKPGSIDTWNLSLVIVAAIKAYDAANPGHHSLEKTVRQLLTENK